MSEIVEAQSVRINFVDGSSRSFAFEPKSFDSSMVATRFEDAIQKGTITLQLDDQIVIVPMSAILSIEIQPGPEIELGFAIKVLHEFD